MTPSPSLSGLGAGAVMLAAVIYARTRALQASQLRLSFNIRAHIAFLLRFTGPYAPAQPAPRALLRRHVTRKCGRPAADSGRR